MMSKELEALTNIIKVYANTNSLEGTYNNFLIVKKALLKNARYSSLEEDFGCPLDIVLKIQFRDIHFVYDENGDRFFINGGGIFKSQFETYRRTDFDFIDKVFKWSDYEKTWWLKADRSE